jgi:tRNA wybutosine-synthesizing protein 3
MVRDVAMDEVSAVIVPLQFGEVMYENLRRLKVLNKQYSPIQISDELALPIYSQHTTVFSTEVPYRIETMMFEQSPPSNNPHQQLREVVKAHLVEGMEHVLDLIPTKWERLDDLILFPKEAFTQPVWDEMIIDKSDFFQQIAGILQARRVGRQQPIANDTIRSSQMELLLGDSGWVEVKDNGLFYGFDACKVMYSSGNVTERHRMGSLDVEGEIIVDAFAGIGYYSLPLLVHGKAAHVHACELNPESIKALEWAAQKNEVARSISIHMGDNQTTLPELRSIADRVLLGLLPSSEAAWELAVLTLKEEGGTLHIHMNVEEEHIEQWIKDTIQTCLGYAQDNGRRWYCSKQHLEKVKWYAPRVRHVVLDVSFSSSNSAS